MNLIQAVALTADGATLEPLRVGHADEMVNVLADESIYSFIGGIPPTLESLRTRYDVQAKGVSPDGSEAWLNWIIRLVDTGQAVGYVQATVTDDGGCQVAEIAWVVSTPFQGRRLATNAAIAMCRFLVDQGVERLMADVHADHAASQGVARAAGLHPTDEVVDGEVRWIADVGSAGYRVRGISASWRLWATRRRSRPRSRRPPPETRRSRTES